MSRPTPDAISMLDPAWHTKINNNFEKVFNAPLPFFQLTEAPPVVPGPGADAPIPGTALSLTGSNGTVVSGSTITNVSGVGFFACAISDVSVNGFGIVRCNIMDPYVATGLDYKIGLRVGSTPYITSSYDSITHRFDVSKATWNVKGLGNNTLHSGLSAPGDEFMVYYHDTSVDYYHNGVLVYTEAVSAGTYMYCAMTFYYVGVILYNVVYSDSLGGPAPALAFVDDARLFKDCVGVYSGNLYVSDGSVWNRIPAEFLENIVALDTGTATLQEIQDAYNALLADLQVKGWMA